MAALKVFISSTYLDNAERRKRVEEAVQNADMIPVGMERFAASAAPTVEECQRLARECELYVGSWRTATATSPRDTTSPSPSWSTTRREQPAATD